jgi:hypothetical protein
MAASVGLALAALAGCGSDSDPGLAGEAAGAGGADQDAAAGTSGEAAGGAAGTAGASSGGTGGSSGAAASAGSSGAAATAGTGGVGGAGGSGGAGGGGVCARWKADRANLSEGAWTGSSAACNAGDLSAPGRPNAVRQVNLFRWLAGLPEVVDDAGRNSSAQQCALMMHANGQLSHNPPSSWKCYSSAGAAAAGKSNIASAAAVAGIDMFMSDMGNATTMGHRRWILSNSLGPIGVGGTSGYSCLHVIGGSGGAKKPWVAWPPAGQVPLGALKVSWQTVDQTGWTVQSDSVALGNAQVSIEDAGTQRVVKVTSLSSGYGSTHAIRMLPQGWQSQAGHTYKVHLGGIQPAIDYSVEVVDCP